jgi:hypothetical protein
MPSVIRTENLKGCEMSRARSPVVNIQKRVRAVRVGGGYSRPREATVLPQSGHASPPIARPRQRARRGPKRP